MSILSNFENYARVNWKNGKAGGTPLGQIRQNIMDAWIKKHNGYIHELDNGKVDVIDNPIIGFDINSQNGEIEVKYLNGLIITYQTALNKIAVNFKYDQEKEKLILIYKDGKTEEIDLSALVVGNDFVDSTNIAWTKKQMENGNVLISASIVKNSITEEHLETGYLTKCQQAVMSTQENADRASEAADSAEESALNAKEDSRDAAVSANRAATSERNAKASEQAAAGSQVAAAKNAAEASASKEAAASSEINAKDSEKMAAESQTAATKSAEMASDKATAASDYATEAESWAHGETSTRQGEDTDNSKYWSEQSKASSRLSRSYLEEVEQKSEEALENIKDALEVLAPSFSVDLSTGHLLYEGLRFVFEVNSQNGHLEWGLAV